jgi:formyltetrahydrofolate deformylase
MMSILAKMSNSKKFILTLSCPDRQGIVAAVSGFLAQNNCNILESAQYDDEASNKFFMRVVFAGEQNLSNKFADIAKDFTMDWQLYDAAITPKIIVMASKASHCLNHILHRARVGTLNAEVCAVISNHTDLKEMADWHKIPFHHLPISAINRAEQEAEALKLFEKYDAELLVLARYMQILSPELSRKLHGKAINIHHSFLPSFKGARPYEQAFERGVKIIGATAHYVTNDLDEGPIIEQGITHVDHTYTAKKLQEAGSDVENMVLSKAVQNHLERRVLINGNKTIVFK